MNDVIDRDEELIGLLARTMNAVAVAAPDLPIEDRRDHRRWLMAAAAIGAIGIAGAGMAVRSGGEPRQLPPLDPNDTRPTLASYVPDESEATVAFVSQERLIRDCMATAGQIYSMTGRDGYPSVDPLWDILGRTDLVRAETIGYNLYPASSYVTRNPNGERSRDAAWQIAFSGAADDQAQPTVPIVDPVTGGDPPGGQTQQASGGCWGSVQKLLYTDQARYTSLSMYVAGQLSIEPFHGTSTDPRLTEPMRAWSECMVDLGHDRYQRPFDPAGQFAQAHEFRDQYWQPSADEIVLAVDDVHCKESSGLQVMAFQLFDAYSRQIVAAAPDGLLNEYKAFVDRAREQTNAHRSGTLDLPWRSTASATALHNSMSCVWLPDDATSLDMSPGELAELQTYVGRLAEIDTSDTAFDQAAAAAVDVPVPPWLLGDSSCDGVVTADQLDSLAELVGSIQPPLP